MKKVIVTGGTGFIGRHCVDELLSRGYEVHALVRKAFANDREKLIQHEVDMMDPKKIENILSFLKIPNLIHLAWYVGPKCNISEVNLDWVVATINLLKSFKNNGGRVFLGAGSCSEYNYSYGLLSEKKTPTNSNTLYGESKCSVFKMANVFCEHNDISFKWPRIFTCYGPYERDTRLMPSAITSCLKGEDIKVSDCLKFQDFIHVEDTARAIVALFESDLNGPVNICSGQPIQLRYIVNNSSFPLEKYVQN